MRIPINLCALLFLGSLKLHSASNPGRDLQKPSSKALDQFLAKQYPSDQPGASVLVKHGQQVLLRKAYGMASLELGVPMKPHHVFRIGSVTKSFGAVVVLQLVDEGKLALDVPISSYLKEAPQAWEKVTIAHLLSHTSGIPSYNAGPQGGYSALRAKRRTLDEVIASFKAQPLEFEPGSRFTYSNSGYALLEKLIVVSTGRGFFENLATRIAGPLRLKHTGGGDPDALIPGLVTGYTNGSSPTFLAPMDFSYLPGGMVSSAEDLAKFTEALHGGKLLRPETYRRMTTRFRLSDGTETEYGLGVWIRSSQGHTLVGHGGDLFGFSTEVEADPTAHTLAVILQNQDKFGTKDVRDVEYLSRRLLAQASGKPIAEPKAVTLSSEQLAKVVGTYATAQGKRVISLENGKLLSRNNGARPYELKASSPTSFFIEGNELRLRFILENGRAISVQRYEDQGEEGPIANRVGEEGTH